jgi:hypothetical protein
MKKAAVRAAILFLAAFYLVVAHAILHPRVSAHYRDYYITRTDFLSPWQHEHLAAIALHTAYSPKEPRLMLDSWDLRDDGEVWNWGRTPAIVFRLDGGVRPDQAHALLLRVGSRGAQHAAWSFNGRPLRTDLVDGDTTLRLELGGLLRPGENTLRVDLPDAQVLPNGDPRMWALRLDSLTVE